MTHTRDERKQQIVAALRPGEYASISVIGSRVGLKTTPYLRNILQELVDEGSLYAQLVTFVNQTEGFVYTLPETE